MTTPSQDPVREALRERFQQMCARLPMDVYMSARAVLNEVDAALALPVQSAEPVARVPGTDPQLLESFAVRAGMVSLLNQGAASCVHSEGCEGVTQEHLTRFCEIVAAYCVESLAPMLADAARTERNRDMWKGQCERQAEELGRLRSPPSSSPASVGEPDAFPFYELRFIMRVLGHKGRAPEQDWKTAYGMARDIFTRWHSLSTAPSTKGGEHG